MIKIFNMLIKVIHTFIWLNLAIFDDIDKSVFICYNVRTSC